MSTVVQRRYTPEEYLALERASEHRSEYVNGQIFAMAGSSLPHNDITGNVYTGLRDQFRGRSCRAWIIDVRVKVRTTGLYTYPDVVAVCGEPLLEGERRDNLLNPALIVEVLSRSTEAYDRGEKFAHYRRLDSLRDYILIAQDQLRVELFVRQGDHWVLSEFNELDDSVPLDSVGCTLSLRQIYDQVDFSAAD